MNYLGRPGDGRITLDISYGNTSCEWEIDKNDSVFVQGRSLMMVVSQIPSVLPYCLLVSGKKHKLKSIIHMEFGCIYGVYNFCRKFLYIYHEKIFKGHSLSSPPTTCVIAYVNCNWEHGDDCELWVIREVYGSTTLTPSADTMQGEAVFGE